MQLQCHFIPLNKVSSKPFFLQNGKRIFGSQASQMQEVPTRSILSKKASLGIVFFVDSN
jgi:hypothetical protein